MSQWERAGRPMDHGRVGCARCARTVARGRRYVVRDGQHQQAWCLGCALRHGMMIRKAVVVAGVIGTVLTLINQGDFLVTGQFGKVGLMKMLLTYSVPFCVSVYSVLAVNRENATDTANEKASEPPPAE